MTPIPAGWKPRLSCPFCGSTCLFTVPDEHGSGGQWVPPIHVGCNDCQAEQVADTEDEAVERWNRRSSPASVAPGDAQAVAWMDPETRDVISAERKASWLSNYGIGGANKAARYTRALGDLRPAPAAGAAQVPGCDLEAAAKKLAECMDYPWAHMPEQGRTHMRKYAQAVIDAALAAQVPQQDKREA